MYMLIACSSHASNSHAHTCLCHSYVHAVMKQKSLENTQMELSMASVKRLQSSTEDSPPLRARLLPSMLCRCVLGWSALWLPQRFTGSGTPARCTDTGGGRRVVGAERV